MKQPDSEVLKKVREWITYAEEDLAFARHEKNDSKIHNQQSTITNAFTGGHFMKISGRVGQIIEEYQARLAEMLGDNLHLVILYGSRARGDAAEDSDIDVLCVMERPFDYGELLDRTSEATAEISLKYDVVLSRTFVTGQDYTSRKTPFLMNVRREGVAL